MSDSRVPAAVDALLAALRAGLTDPATVFDGPTLAGQRLPVEVVIGWNGDPDGDMQAVTGWTQTWAGLGAQRKDEVFDVLCCVVAFTGDTDVKSRRDAVFAAFGEVEDVVRAQVNIGLGLPQPTRAEFSSGELFQEQLGDGLQCRIPFVVSVTTRI